MALQSSGAISLGDIEGEFGGTAPTSLSEYYSAAAGVPASGEISLTDFYGTSSRVAINITLGNTSNYNLYDNRGGTYVAGSSDITLTISGTVSATSTATAALRTGTFASGDTVTIINNGAVRAFGGNGGAGGSTSAGAAGAAGGHAIDLGFATTLTNNNLIQGGGGGGGGGGSWNYSESQPKGSPIPRSYGGGGGGGGSGVGLGGAGGYGFTGSGAAGATGGADTGGAGGGGASAAGDGGAGGNRGVAGANGAAQTYAGGTGGAAGKAVLPNGNTLTLTNNGSIFGATA